ncbi:MAG: hypothetical protein PHC61_15325 [Chitinivibrionales bacterium]|nr:hypothetical protein [Chitinivibrionales bacterium]
MKISGFSFVRNADTLYYPAVASIRSVLPICNEFIIAVGKGDPGDRTRELIAAIGDPKIKIIDTVWPEFGVGQNHIFAQQTDIALHACSGDWCLYVQCDEVVHEKYLPTIENACRNYLNEKSIEGFLFKFNHFWGDYEHVLVSHCWYPLEIRLVRNGQGVASYKDAQSFRINGRKLRVAALDVCVNHYGWVRPPDRMQRKRRSFTAAYQGQKAAGEQFSGQSRRFDYGPLNKIHRFTAAHPAVMREWIGRFD